MSSLFTFPIHNEVFLSAISGFDLILFLSNSYLPKRNKDLISSPHPPSSPLPSNSAFQKEGAKLNESPIGETCRKMGFPGVSKCKESACNEGGLGLIPGLGRSHGEGKGYPLQYSGLDNSRDYAVHGVAKSWTRLSDFHFHFLFYSIDVLDYIY